MPYVVQEQDRENIASELVYMLPENERDGAKKKILEIADLFEGQDENAIGLLWRAAEHERFDEYAQKLLDYHQEKGQYVSPSDRRAISRANLQEPVLRMMAQREEQIANGTRPAKDRTYLPEQMQKLITKRGAVNMELFFLDCYRDLMG